MTNICGLEGVIHEHSCDHIEGTNWSADLSAFEVCVAMVCALSGCGNA